MIMICVLVVMADRNPFRMRNSCSPSPSSTATCSNTSSPIYTTGVKSFMFLLCISKGLIIILSQLHPKTQQKAENGSLQIHTHSFMPELNDPVPDHFHIGEDRQYDWWQMDRSKLSAAVDEGRLRGSKVYLNVSCQEEMTLSIPSSLWALLNWS